MLKKREKRSLRRPLRSASTDGSRDATGMPAEVVYEMVEDDSIGDVLVSYKASDKTPFFFHLRVISGNT